MFVCFSNYTHLPTPPPPFEPHGAGLPAGPPSRGSGPLRLNFGCPRTRLLEGLEKIARAIDPN